MFRFTFAAALLGAAPVASAAVFAVSSSSYTQGSGAAIAPYSNPATAVGAPDAITGEIGGFPNILNPFSPAYETDEIVGIGLGGQITLSFPLPIAISPTQREFGVISNIGLMDTFNPPGTNTNPAGTFNANPRVVDVAVSADGLDFRPAGRVTFGLPANYFTNAGGPYAPSAPASPVVADFGQPFLGTLSTFDGLDFAATIAAFNGSGGGTWIDLDPLAVGLSSFSHVRFSIPAGGIAGSDNYALIDAIVANNALVPEPGSAAVLALLWAARRRR